MTQIRVELQLADGSFTSGMLRAGQSLAQFERQLIAANPRLAAIQATGTNVIRSMNQMDGSTKSFLSTLRDLSIVTGVVSMGLGAASKVAHSWIGDIVRINSEMERLRFQMQAMSTASDPIKDAAENVKYLREQAGSMPFSMKEITSTFVKLKASGIDPMNGSLRALADGIAAFGGTDEQLHRVTLGISQVAGKGVLQMEELRQQIGESMPNAMQLMARSMGVSVGQLAKEVATGTVAGKEALEKFKDELDRAYGGTAIRTMQTFAGQWSQLQTNFQNLATNEGGKGFFDQVKNQLVDLNRFLRSDFANVLATDVGNALSTFIDYLRSGVSFIWEFREAIVNVGAVLAAGFGINSAIAGLTALRGAVTATTLALPGMAAGFRQGFADVALGMTGFRQLSNVSTGVRIALGGVATAALAAGSAVMTFAPWVVAIGLAAYTAGEYFGWFSNKVTDAYEEIKKFGAETQRQAENITGAYIADIEDQLRKERKRISEEQFDSVIKPEDIDETYGRVGELESKLKAAREESAKIVGDAGKREQRNMLESLELALADRVALAKASYTRENIELEKKYDADLIAVKNGTKAMSKVESDYRDSLLKNQKTLSDATIAVTKAEITAQEDLYKAGDANQKRLATAALDFLQEKLAAQMAAANKISKEQFGVPTTTAPVDEEKLVNKGKQTLDSLRQDIAGLNAELHGASGAVAEMQARIAQNDFGSIEEGGDAVRKLHQDLLDAAAAKEGLDKLMKGQQKAQNDIDKIRMDQLEEEMKIREEMAGGDLNDAEKMKVRLENGYYEGLGPIDKVKEAVIGVVGALDAQGLSANDVSRVMQQTAFGDQTVSKVNGVTDALRKMAEQILNIGTGLNGLNFSNLGRGINSSLSGPNPFANMTSSSDAFLNFIAQGESKGDYNATLDNGRWTGGPQNLTSMTLNQIRELQRGMLTPENQAKYEGGGSSALGRYQIVGKTLEGLMSSMGLTGNELFTPEMQDAMARKLIEGRQGQGLDGLRKEWTSLNNRSDADIMAAMNSQKGPTVEKAVIPGDSAVVNAQPQYDVAASQERINALVKDRVGLTEKLGTELDDLSKKQDDLDNQKGALALKKTMQDLDAETVAAGKAAEEGGEKYKQLVEAIKNGKIYKGNLDPDSAVYAKALEAAKALDAKNKEIAEAKKNQTAIDRELGNFEERRVEIARRIAEEKKKAADPTYKPDSSEMQKLITDLDTYIAKVKEAAGADYENNEKYKAAVAYKQQMLSQQGQLEGATIRAKWAQENRTAQESLMTQSQARQAAMQRQLADVDQMAAKMRAAGDSEVEITQAVEARKAAIRAQYAQQSSPLQKQMAEWGDAQEQLSQGATRWMDSLAGGLTDLITGTGDLRSAIQGILKDMVNMGVKYMMSQMFQGAKGTTGAATGKGAGLGKSQAASAGKGKMAAGMFHTGGIIGGRAPGRKVASSLAFMNAPKFHSGGIVGGKKLHHSEVPIIAQKGEGVFTAEQMSKMGGFQANQAISVSAPITVQGSAGTPEQNADLAQRMKRELEGSMRGVVADELRRQMRPGNMLSR
jgi:tape measure domain-containing protein